MAYHITKTLPTLDESTALTDKSLITPFIQSNADTIRRILNGQDHRKMIICGPCSIHSRASALMYAERMQKLSAEVQDTLFLVMRTYFEKPRTQYAWKGFFHQPSVTGPLDLTQGLTEARSILLEIAAMGVATGAEILTPALATYYEDLISWGCIGARTSESQTHREIASSLSIPVGFKNSTQGNIEIAVNGMISAEHSHQLVRVVDGEAYCVISDGNPHCHLVLRGCNFPVTASNYQQKNILHAMHLLEKNHLNTGLLVDCSHGNCEGDHHKQIQVADTVLQYMKQGLNIKGILLESHIRSGRAEIQGSIAPDISITDPCVSWDETEKLIRHWHQSLSAPNFAML